MTVFAIDPNTHRYSIFGVPLLGASPENLHKLLLSVGFVVLVAIVSYLVRKLMHALFGGTHHNRVRFWTRQGIHLVTALVLVVGLLSIWFDNPTRLATFMGLMTAGLAFALQRVITAFAGYLLILRGKTFNVGDRITMGGVRGDVVALGFLQTTIMEMGQPPQVQQADPAMWVLARQYSGRIVTITNAKIFDEPVYNYSRHFPYIWEEMHIPISYKDDWKTAERILTEAAEKFTAKIEEMSEEDLQELERRYALPRSEVKPRVFVRLTDNWIELTVRFIVADHKIRFVKDGMSRELLEKLGAAGIGIASSTYDVVGFPPVQVELRGAAAAAMLGGGSAGGRELRDGEGKGEDSHGRDGAKGRREESPPLPEREEH